MYGLHGPGNASIHWKATSKSVFSLSSSYLTDTNVLAYANRDFNRAMPSGLVAEDYIWQLLEIPIGEYDYRVVLLTTNLRASHL